MVDLTGRGFSGTHTFEKVALSCCTPELQQPPEVRLAFAVADEGRRMKWLGTFLGAAMARLAPDTEIHVAVIEPEDPS